MKGHFASRKEITMSSVEHRSPLEKSVPLIYRLQRWFLAACIVLGPAATLVMVATNPGYYNSQTGEAGLLAGYASANVVMVQIHLISAVITFYLLPVGLLVMAWLAMRRAPWLASIGAFLVLLACCLCQPWLQPSSLSPMTSCAREAILCSLPWSSSSITMGS